MIDLQDVKVKNTEDWDSICPFPVGYVYMSSNSTSPANIYGGTWSAISGGRYMRAADAWGNGGSDIISIDQMPKHSHSLRWAYQLSSSSEAYGLIPYSNSPTTDTVGSGRGILSTGGGQPFYPTYQNVWAWYRIA